MGLLINNTLANALVNFSSPSDVVRGGLLKTIGEAKLRANQIKEQQGKTAANSPQCAMFQGAAVGMGLGIVSAPAVFLSPAVASPAFRAQNTLPGLRSITTAMAGTVPVTLASEAGAYAVNNWLSAPLLARAEKLKDAPGAEGGALQALAIAAKWGAVWLTEVPRLAVTAVLLSTAIVCGTVGAAGGLAYYGVMNVLAAFRRSDTTGAPPAAADAPAASADAPSASSPAPEAPAAS
jgi:hypothetical protein